MKSIKLSIAVTLVISLFLFTILAACGPSTTVNTSVSANVSASDGAKPSSGTPSSDATPKDKNTSDDPYNGIWRNESAGYELEMNNGAVKATSISTGESNTERYTVDGNGKITMGGITGNLNNSGQLVVDGIEGVFEKTGPSSFSPESSDPE